MRLVIVLVVSMFVSIVPVMAKPYVLRCTEVEVEGYRPELAVDLDPIVMKWGKLPKWQYLITSVTDEYITGLDNDDPVGAEVIVLNRFSGEYKRALVGVFCQSSSNCAGGNTILRAFTITGQCMRSML